MIPVLTPEEMRAVDAASPDPVEVLIARAGAAVASAALAMLGGTYGRTVHVIAGPGNNGADGRAAAAVLSGRGVRVRVHPAETCPAVLPPADLVIDAAFGTGFRGEWRAPEVSGTPVLAVDIPSGLDGLTGLASGRVLRARRTVTFAAAKPGLLFGDGPRCTGEIEVADIGLDVGLARVHLVEAADVAAWVPARPIDAHKWESGVRVVAGSPGMTGAAWLVSGAAQRAGAGIVHLSSPGVEAPAPIEVVGRRIAGFDWAEAVLADLHRFRSLVVGPGLGREDHTVPSVVRLVADAEVPTVVDGDGLFALAWNEDGAPTMLRRRTVPTVITPHDGEYTLLTGVAPGADRIHAARRLAVDTGATVLLKGPTTVVSDPHGRVVVVTEGDQRLATAGSGDVLSGIIGALLAVGVEATQAAAAGAWIHGAAASAGPPRGLVASDLLGLLPAVWERLGLR